MSGMAAAFVGILGARFSFARRPFPPFVTVNRRVEPCGETKCNLQLNFNNNSAMINGLSTTEGQFYLSGEAVRVLN